MRQITKILAMALMAVLFAGSAWAFSTWTWNLESFDYRVKVNGENTLLETITFNDSLGLANGPGFYSQITQNLGGNGQIDNGDSFSEFGILGAVIADGVNTIAFRNEDDQARKIFYSFTDLTGKVSNYSSDTLLDLVFAPNVGTIKLFAGTDYNDENIELASFSLVSGLGKQVNVTQGASNNNAFSFTIAMASVRQNFWFIDGMDAFDILKEGRTVLGFANLNANVKTFSADNDNYYIGVENYGNINHAVPEPGTLLLLGAGLLGLGAVARRRKN